MKKFIGLILILNLLCSYTVQGIAKYKRTERIKELLDELWDLVDEMEKTKYRSKRDKSSNSEFDNYPCETNDECEMGQCDYVQSDDKSICECDENVISVDSICDYELENKTFMFLMSFFLGGLGVDWFILAKGNGGYIAAGVFKLLTGGGLGIWWIVDWARILADDFPDGNDKPIGDW